MLDGVYRRTEGEPVAPDPLWCPHNFALRSERTPLRDHGVLAPNAKLRALVVPRAPEEATDTTPDFVGSSAAAAAAGTAGAGANGTPHLRQNLLVGVLTASQAPQINSSLAPHCWQKLASARFSHWQWEHRMRDAQGPM